MKLGAFSISLGVKDLANSMAFYEALGFQSFAGTEDHGYLILKNGDHLVGIFQGMFDGNMLTFNPKWSQNGTLVPGDDVRDIFSKVKDAGLETCQESGLENRSGPASFIVVDPDGNPVLIDQHV